jgi:apolipoprotein N-acyltransferase
MVLNSIQWSTPSGVTKTVALVQGNIAQSTRFDPEKDLQAMDKYLQMTEPFWTSDIVIWPEAAVSRIEPLVQEYLSALDKKATATNTGLITGLINYDVSTEVAHNTLAALGIDTNINSEPYVLNHSKRYAKHHLLPIGEFVPFETMLRPLAPIFDLPMSSFSRGDYIQPNLIAGNIHFAPAICFEIAFPKQIAANLTNKSHAIVTVSNDAWFGDSHGPHQHLQIAQVRAKEFGLPVLRATNNGVTAIVDHQGHIQGKLPQFEEGVLTDTIVVVKGTTPYRRYGDWPIWILAILGMALGIMVKHNTQKT